MKLIMESWRRFIKESYSDPPGDGLKPVDPKTYATHAGGEDPQLPLLRPPDEIPKGAPIKDRPALNIDHEEGTWPAISLDKLDRNIQSMVKSDSPLNIPSAKKILNKYMDGITRELTNLEAAETISPHDASRQKEMMDEFREILAQSDTLDMDLYHIHKELNDMKNSLRALKTRS